MSSLPAPVLTVASDGDEILHHLLIDFLAKAAIVVTAVVFVVLGMVIIWRKVGNPRSDEQTPTHSSNSHLEWGTPTSDGRSVPGATANNEW